MRFEMTQETISCLKVIGDIINDATFVFTEKGLQIYEMTKDQSNMVMFNFFIETDLNEKFVIDMSKLTKILRIPKELDSVFFTVEKGEGEVKIEIRSEGFEREFFVKKLVPEENEFNPENIRKLEFTTKFNVSKPMFNRIIDEAMMFNNFCFIITTDVGEKATLIAEDDAGKGYKSEFDADYIKAKSAKSKYDLDNIKKSMKANTDTFEISMGENYPMKIFFSRDNFDFSLLIAPLINDD